MATVFKVFQSDDITSKGTVVHEATPITGTIVSGGYVYYDATPSLIEANIKNYTHGLYQSVYDYPYLSSSGNHMFDIGYGFSSGSALSGAATTQNAKKINIYNQMAQVLAGYNENGIIREFDQDGDLTSGTKLKECIFITFSRLLVKDEIKKGSFNLELGVDPAYSMAANGGTTFNDRILITDVSGNNGYFTNSPAGDYGVLYATASAGINVMSASLAGDGLNQQPCGLIYYQAGVVVLSGSALTSEDYATAVDCIDTTGYVASNADASFTILIPSAAGGLGGPAVTILLDEDKDDGTPASAAANTISIGTSDAAETDALAASYIINAINGVTAGRFVYASSGNGEASDDLGITAKQGSSDTQITLTMDQPGSVGNIEGALATASGLNIVDVTAFTDGRSGPNSLLKVGEVDMSPLGTTPVTISDMLTGSTIQKCADGLRNRIYNISFNNTTELNSSIYFCRVNHNDFNYSSNVTYLSASKIRVKEELKDLPISYITSIGLYSPDNELLATAKLSEPIYKAPTEEYTFKVRLDY